MFTFQIYVKREQSMRTRTPPVIQRRCSLQGSLRYNITHNKAEKAEHPLAKLSHSHWYTEDYEQQDGGAVSLHSNHPAFRLVIVLLCQIIFQQQIFILSRLAL